MRVSGPDGRPVEAAIALEGTTAVLELATAAGLGLLRDPAPLIASTRGVGELVSAALDAGARRIVLGLGGSATTDGGAGMLQALGVRLLGDDGADLPPGGGALRGLARIVVGGLDPRLAGVEFVVATDVDNPLLGEQGAAAVFVALAGVVRLSAAEVAAAGFAGAHALTEVEPDLARCLAAPAEVLADLACRVLAP